MKPTRAKPRKNAQRSSASDVEKYIARTPEPARSTLKKIRATIRSVVPAETIEVISYGIPTFKYKGGLFGYAAFSAHCSLFPMGSAVITAFKDELKNYSTSRGTIRFPVDKPPPATLIKRLVKARVAANERKPLARSRR